MTRKEDIFKAALELLNAIKDYDDNHPEVVPKSILAETIIKKIAKVSSSDYYQGIGIVEEAKMNFNVEWYDDDSLEIFKFGDDDEQEDNY